MKKKHANLLKSSLGEKRHPKGYFCRRKGGTDQRAPISWRFMLRDVADCRDKRNLFSAVKTETFIFLLSHLTFFSYFPWVVSLHPAQPASRRLQATDMEGSAALFLRLGMSHGRHAPRKSTAEKLTTKDCWTLLFLRNQTGSLDILSWVTSILRGCPGLEIRLCYILLTKFAIVSHWKGQSLCLNHETAKNILKL